MYFILCMQIVCLSNDSIVYTFYFLSQSEVGHKLLEDTARPKDFYFYYYNRDLELISKVNTLVSGLTMLSQATKSLVQGRL